MGTLAAVGRAIFLALASIKTLAAMFTVGKTVPPSDGALQHSSMGILCITPHHPGNAVMVRTSGFVFRVLVIVVIDPAVTFGSIRCSTESGKLPLTGSDIV